MEASRVTISKQTLERANKELSRPELQERQREAIIAYIENVPTGTLINVSRMGRQLNLSEAKLKRLSGFLQDMVRDGLIIMEGGRKTKYRRFTVLRDVKTVKVVEQRSLPLPEPETGGAPIVDDDNPPSTHTYTADELEKKAMQYAWTYGSDLQGFITWLKSQED